MGLSEKNKTAETNYGPGFKPDTMSKTRPIVFKACVQRTKDKQFRICIYSAINGKLIAPGEPLKRKIQACSLAADLSTEFGDPNPFIEVLPASHKWPSNAGPKKKATTKKK